MNRILKEGQGEYLDQFKRENDPLILEMEEFAAKHNIPILSWQSADFLEILIKMLKPGRVLEIGTAIAYSSIRIAKNLSHEAVIQTIEFSSDNAALAKKNIAKSGLGKKIELLEGNALDIMPGLDEEYDFIFLDADKEDYLDLFNLSVNLLKKDGVIFIDNLLWHGYAAVQDVPENYRESARHIKEFNKMLMSHKGLKTTIIPVGDGIGLGVKV